MDIIAKARVYRAIIEKAMATADEQLIAKAPTFVKHWAVNEAVVPGDIRYDKLTEKAYKVRENMGHTTQENWEPSKILRCGKLLIQFMKVQRMTLLKLLQV